MHSYLLGFEFKCLRSDSQFGKKNVFNSANLAFFRRDLDVKKNVDIRP
jgi:hypothetical protein